MPDQEDLELIVRQLEEIHAGVRDEEPTLGLMMNRVTEAVALHRRFRAAFESGNFDVRMLVQRPDGSLEEKPFDWRALDASGA